MQATQVFDRYGAGADRALVLRGSAKLGQALLEVRKIVQVAWRGARHFAQLKAGQPVPNVGGVRDLAHLTITDHIDAGRRLPGHHGGHFGGHGGVELGGVVVQPTVLGKQLGHNPFGPRQAADMGGEYALCCGVERRGV